MSRNKSKQFTKSSITVDKPKNDKATDVDICIPVYGNYKMLMDTLSQLPMACQKYKYKIYIVDDCSPDYEQNGKAIYDIIEKSIPGIEKIVKNKVNSGFPKTANSAVTLGGARNLVILSTDVFMFDGAIDRLVDEIEQHKDVGIVAPKLLFPNKPNTPDRPAGKVQHAGLVFGVDGRPYHLFSGWDSDHPFVNTVKDLNAVTGAILVMRRDVFIKAGGFDIDFGRGTFEDIVLCFKVKIMGLKVRYLPDAVGYHYVGASAMMYNAAYPMDRNYNIFKAKYGELVPLDDFLYAGGGNYTEPVAKDKT